jgi:energy-converting hydrogenase Eha subunit B
MTDFFFCYRQLYDEFGPAFTTLGDTAGVRGTIYSNDARMNGLTEEFIEGSLDGTCSSVASKGTLLCTYELFFLDSETGFMATLVATGSVSLELFQPNLLMVEATGDDFGYKNGLLSLTYTAGGAQPVVEIDIIV